MHYEGGVWVPDNLADRRFLLDMETRGIAPINEDHRYRYGRVGNEDLRAWLTDGVLEHDDAIIRGLARTATSSSLTRFEAVAYLTEAALGGLPLPKEILEPDEQRLTTYETRLRARRYELIADLIIHSVIQQSASKYYGFDQETINQLVAYGQALSFTDQETGEVFLPGWQFRDNPDEPIIPEVLELAQAFPGDLVELNGWLYQPHEDLDWRTPAAALQSGDGKSVLLIIRAIGSAGR